MSRRLSLITTLLICAGAIARAQQTPPLPKDAELDRQLERAMRERHVSGAVVAVVTADSILLMRAYGLADQATGTPMRPDTVIGLQSTSKLVTGLTALSLASRQVLRLDADVTPHLGARVRLADRGRPVSLNDLLTHTAGFDQRGIAVSARRPQDLRGLETYLSGSLPARMWKTGAIANYSNEGFALAGLVLERASGVKLPALAAQAVFEPLGMKDSTLEHPAPSRFAGRKATGYMWRNGYVPVPQILHHDWPASGAVSTAEDMARLLQALLRDAQPAWRPALTPHFRAHPELTGVAIGGFVEQRRQGLTVLRHGGDWQDYFNLVALVPANGIGVFIATNHGQDEAFGELALNAILEWSLGAPRAQGAVDPRPAPAEAAGTYRFTRHEHRGLGKLGVLTGQIPEVRLEAGSSDPAAARDGSTFRMPSGELWAFRPARDGDPAFLFRERIPSAAYERVGWLRTARTQRALWGIAVGLLILRLVWIAIRRRWTLAEAPGVLLLTFIAGLAVILARVDPWELQYGLPFLIRMWLVLPWVASVLAVVAFPRHRSYASLALTLFVLVLVWEWNLWKFWI